MSRIGRRLPAIEVVPDPEAEPVPTTPATEPTPERNRHQRRHRYSSKGLPAQRDVEEGWPGKGVRCSTVCRKHSERNCAATRAAGHFPPEQKRCLADSVEMPVDTYSGASGTTSVVLAAESTPTWG